MQSKQVTNNFYSLHRWIFSLLIISMPLSTIAEDKIKMQGTSIIGNKELPKVLYIVPWKNSELPDINVPPINSLIDEALSPIDRDTFQRQLNNYYRYSRSVSTQTENQ